MFDFTSPIKRKRVQAVLTNRVNQKCMDELHGNGRDVDRTPYVHALIAVPGTKRKWRYEEAFPVLGRDISPSGVAVLHSSEVAGELLIEIPGQNISNFVRCVVQHANDLGFGYWHIGLSAKEIVELSREDYRALQKRLAEINVQAEIQTPTKCEE